MQSHHQSTLNKEVVYVGGNQDLQPASAQYLSQYWSISTLHCIMCRQHTEVSLYKTIILVPTCMAGAWGTRPLLLLLLPTQIIQSSLFSPKNHVFSSNKYHTRMKHFAHSTVYHRLLINLHCPTSSYPNLKASKTTV